jgi:undecaprenyl diphosphate synthase
MSFKEKIKRESLPAHIAIIMDGNGRWAKQQGQLRTFGHQNGVTSVRETVEACAELGVGFLTLYAFSTENWNRPRYEVDALMELLVSTINNELDTLLKNDIRLTTIGDMSSLPRNCHDELCEAMERTRNNRRMTLVLALSYSGRWEIIDAVKQVAEQVKNNALDPSEINESYFSGLLNTSRIPDPELLIRTSGECRVSNFLLWQIAYTELYFTPTLWPDFRKEDLYEAIYSFQNRERRFGMTSEQLNNSI